MRAITAVSKRLGMTAETLRSWIRQQGVSVIAASYVNRATPCNGVIQALS